MAKRLVLFIIIGLTALTTVAQTFSVEGRVVNEEEEPVIGASVFIDGTKRGTATDIDGHFVLTGVERGQKLVVTYVGMKSTTVSAKPQVLIRMESEVSLLDEVMVVAFGKQTRSSFTGSAGIVDSKKLEHKQLTNVMSGLQGEVTGVQMTNNSGSPDSEPTLRIRGFSSLNAGLDPLVIVDGAPYDGGWNNLNPNDVASITVLKDAASNALYGARGANGVILITTKKAAAGDAQVTLDAKWGVNSRIERDYNLINDPRQYYETYYKALYNYQVNEKGLSPYVAHTTANSILSSNDKTSGGLGYVTYTVPDGEYLIGENGRLNPNATLGSRVYNNGQIYTLIPDDWKDAAFRNGLRQEYNLSITGGNERSQFYGSIGYLKNEGIAQPSAFERFSARMKAEYQAKNWLRVGGNVNYTHANYNYVSSSYDTDVFATVNGIAPIYPLYIRDANGNIMSDSNGVMYDYGDGDLNGQQRPYIPQSNPIQENQLNTSKYKENMFGFSGYADIDIYDGLKLTVNGTGTVRNTRSTFTQQPFYGFGTITYPDGWISKDSYETFSYNLQQLLNYTKKFGSHHIDLLLGHEYYRTTGDQLVGVRTGMASYFENQTLSGAIKVIDAYDNVVDYNNEGFFFRGQYDYAQRYFGSVSFRRDASSRFHPDHRWGNFYSVGGAWIMTKESWLKPNGWLQMLKLKASFGQQGNDNIGNFLYMDTYAIDNNGSLAITQLRKGNPNITWETNNNFNSGIEFELFGGRMRGGIEYFYRKTTDMLCFVYAPYSAGYSGSYYNIGDMTNHGVEIELSGDIIRTNDLVWSVNFNATHYKNEITMIAEELKKNKTVDGHAGYTSSTNYVGEGLPMYTWYLKKYAGVNGEGRSQWYDRDANGNLTTTTSYGDADYFLCGDPHPDLYGGFGTSLSYRGFDLSVTFSYSIGGLAYDYGYASAMSNPYGDSSGKAIHKDILNAWSSENPTSNIPRWQYGDLYSAGMSDRFLTDASYLTLQNVNLGYNLPKAWYRKLGLGGVRVYVAGDNLYYWSKRKGFDPRGSFSGQTSTTGYSTSRCISGGVNVRF
ncbi:MAG: SusC/RagA family TonB-linked outer membrane protein [Muribaculaceae bacterium]